MRNYKLLLCIPLILLGMVLTGCASITNGVSQDVAVSTKPKGADCILKNSKGEWEVKQTPGVVEVHRDHGALNVQCSRKGYGKSVKVVASHVKGALFGNILFGGVVGAGIDATDGAAFSYPQKIIVAMNKHQAVS